MLNEAEPNQEGFAFSTFTLNGEDADPVRRCEHLHIQKRIIEFEAQPVLIFWLTYFCLFF